MNEQKIYHVTAVVRIDDIIEATGIIQGIERKILFDGKVAATSARSAEIKALVDKTYNADNLEVSVVEVNFPR